MIIFDFFCSRCGRISESYCRTRSMKMYCNVCQGVTQHEKACNGGARSRYRYMDLPSDYKAYRGCVDVSVDAHTVDDSGREKRDVVFAGSGEEVAKSKKYTREAIKEKKEQIYFKRDVEQGRRKSYNVGVKK